MPTLVIRSPDGTEQEHEFAEQLTIGRAVGNDLVLAEGGVSRTHCRFFLEGDAVNVEDMGSSNGTWVDGERLEGPAALTPQRQVVIGDYEIVLKQQKERTRGSGGPPARIPRSTRVVASVKGQTGVSNGSAVAKRAGAGRATGPQLRGLTGGVTGKVFTLVGKMTVGRVSAADLTIDDDSVSRKHAELEVNGRDVVIRDLGSANGTTVNGAPITDELVLNSGDIVQFGIVELMFETGGAGAGGRSIVRRGGDRPVRGGRGGRGPDGDPEAVDPNKRRALIIGSAVIAVLFVAVLAAAFGSGGGGGGGVGGGNQGSGKKHKGDSSNDIEELMTECRTYSSADVGRPDWKRAAAACNKVVEIEPIHADALALLKRIQVEKTCEENLEKGKELASSGQIEASIEAYAKVGAKEGECPVYALRALDIARDVVTEVKKLAGRECKEYSTNARWENAYRRCELYMRLACQSMDDKDLYPPALSKMILDGPSGRGEWKPSDPLYINFLKARQRLKPNEPPWRCPVIPAFRPPRVSADPAKSLKDEFLKRYKNPEMGESLVRYFDGREDSLVLLQKITENMSRADEHDAAKALMGDIAMADNQMKGGLTELTNGKPDRAAPKFRKALEIDEKLVLADKRTKMDDEARRAELDRRPSFVRRTVIEMMSKSCLDRGRISAEHQDFAEACRLWKLGASFSRSNMDLLQALTRQCTQRAGDKLKSARGCRELQQVVDFAVDGDGIRELALAKMEEEHCDLPEQ